MIPLSDIIRIIASITALAMLARSILFWLNFIQAKHYHPQRLFHVFREKSFSKLLYSRHRIIIAVLIFIFIVFRTEKLNGPAKVINYEPYELYFTIAILPLLVYLLIYFLQSTKSVANHSLRVPSLTLKIIALFVAVFFLEMFFSFRVAFIPYAAVPTFLIIEIFQPVIVLGTFFILYIPNIFIHKYFNSRATRKISLYKNLTVIGITGSYGKTTTKEFLAHILSKKFKVLKTPAHINVDTGVARVILRALKPEHAVFIVEMGAYRKGEIKKTCDLVKPTHGLITGLSDQHLELFGSLKAISEAKFELIAAVGEQTRIIANSDSKPLIIEFERRSMTPVWYGLSERAVLKARNPRLTADGLSFEINNISFRTTIFGIAGLNNLLGAITMAQNLGMDLNDISRAVGTLAPFSHTMELKSGPNSALLIDDTYNANTEGVLTAIQDLQYTARPKRVMVFSEVIELGDQAEEDHCRIVDAILKHTTHFMLLPGRLQKFMKDKLITGGYSAAQFINTAAELKMLLDKDTVVLFEGRDAQKLLNSL